MDIGLSIIVIHKLKKFASSILQYDFQSNLIFGWLLSYFSAMFFSGQDEGFKCNHCDQAPKTKVEFMRHLKSNHFPELAPWQCPICQYKCKSFSHY